MSAEHADEVRAAMGQGHNPIDVYLLHKSAQKITHEEQAQLTLEIIHDLCERIVALEHLTSVRS